MRKFVLVIEAFKHFSENGAVFLDYRNRTGLPVNLLFSDLIAHQYRLKNGLKDLQKTMISGMTTTFWHVGTILSRLSNNHDGVLNEYKKPFDLTITKKEIALEIVKLGRLGAFVKAVASMPYNPINTSKTLMGTCKLLPTKENL